MTCPVTALLMYLNQRGNDPGALFRTRDGVPLSRSHLPAANFAGHNFRIGAATTAAAAGVADSTIQTLGH